MIHLLKKYIHPGKGFRRSRLLSAFRQHTFGRIVVLLTVPCVVFTVLLVFLSRSYLYDFFEGIQRDSMQKTTNQIAFSLQGSIQQTENMLLNLEPYCLEGASGSYPDLAKELDVIYKYRKSYLDGVVFLGADKTVVGVPTTYWYFGDAEKKIIAEMVRKNPKGLSWSTHFYSNIAWDGNSGSHYVPLDLVALPIYKGGAYRGVLAAVVDLSKMVSSLSIYSNDYSLNTYIYEETGALADQLSFVVGNTYLLIPVPEAAEELQNLTTAKQFLAKKNRYSAYCKIELNPYWTVLTVGNIDVLEKGFQPFNQNFSLMLVGSFTALLVIYIFVIQWWFTRPLCQLSTAIQKVGGGDFDYRIEINRKDEFGKVADEFNHMSKLVKDLVSKLHAADLHIRQSDVAFLLSQINPHFLYNTLDAIDIMVDVSSKEEVHQALGELVTLLRYGLRKNQVSQLEDEFEYIRNYLELLKLRYGSNLFEYHLEEGEGTGRVKLLKLLIQPIVENAVFHGFHPLKGRKGFLEIRSWLDGGDLRISVTDNGVGMPERKLQSILQGRAGEPKTGGIGIANVDERIRLYYGPQYGIRIASEEGIGTRVVIRVPAARGELPAEGGTDR